MPTLALIHLNYSISLHCYTFYSKFSIDGHLDFFQFLLFRKCCHVCESSLSLIFYSFTLCLSINLYFISFLFFFEKFHQFILFILFGILNAFYFILVLRTEPRVSCMLCKQLNYLHRSHLSTF